MLGKKGGLFNVLFEAASEGIIVVDTNHEIVSANEAAESIFGYEKGELSGKPLALLVPEKYKPKHKGDVTHFFKEGKRRQINHDLDIYGKRKDGDLFPMESSLNPFVWKGEKYVMSLIIDITERKKSQLEIRELNNSLEEKIKSRTQELEESISELQKLNLDLEEEVKRRKKAEKKMKESLRREKELSDLKSKFLSMVSHEFKTPLSGISTSVMLAEKYKKEEQQEKREKHFKIIQGKVQYLNNILNDFLSIERMETGRVKYNFVDFSLSKLLNEVVYSANVTLKSGQEIDYPQDIEEITLHQEEKILKLILSNLLNNAIKYSSENTAIAFEVKTEGDHIIFKVEDEGIGIPEEDQKHIFERYFRAENALLEQGTGIGLNTAKMHLENLGGNMSFESEVGVGTTFTVELPIKK